MLRNIGQIGQKKLLLATGFDAIRGIIGREELLEHNLLVFENCPQVHSFLVVCEFYLTCFSKNYEYKESVLIKPNRTSKFYGWTDSLIESREYIAEMEFKKIKDLIILDKK